MFGLLSPTTYTIDDIKLTDFRPWAVKLEKAGSKLAGPNAFKTSNAYNKLKAEIINEYHGLRTLEAKLFAAYSSFDPTLKDLIKAELASHHLIRARLALGRIYIAFIRNGLSGCAHLLRTDYSNDFEIIEEGPSPSTIATWLKTIETFPSSWTRNQITLGELEALHISAYKVPISAHANSPAKTSFSFFEWNTLSELLDANPSLTIYNYDSGFSTGVVLFYAQSCMAIATLTNYRRQA